MPLFRQNTNKKQTGTLKFYSKAQQYGFIIKDSDAQDIFFHFSDVDLDTVNFDAEQQLFKPYQRFQFIELKYIDKKKRQSRKAINIQFIN